MMRSAVTSILMFCLLLAGCSQAPPLEKFGKVPSFTLTDQEGKEFSSPALDGKLWIANFIYTNCTGPCPLMSARMRRVQEALKNTDVHFVSFTVDPERDTPPVLAAYARRYHAIPGRWHFLTGAKETLHKLNRDGFKLGTVDDALEHSTRFVVIDRTGEIRGYYVSSQPESVGKMLDDVKTLLKEKA